MTLPNKTCQCVGLKENDVVLKASLDLSYPLSVTAIHLSVITRILFWKVPTSEFCAAKSLKPKLVSTPATKVCFQEFPTFKVMLSRNSPYTNFSIVPWIFMKNFMLNKSNSTFLPFEMRWRKWKWRVLQFLCCQQIQALSCLGRLSHTVQLLKLLCHWKGTDLLQGETHFLLSHLKHPHSTIRNLLHNFVLDLKDFWFNIF